MQVRVKLELEELKKRLCPGCREAMDKYLKELAAQALTRDVQESKEDKE